MRTCEDLGPVRIAKSTDSTALLMRYDSDRFSILQDLQDLQVLDHFGPCVLTFLSKNGFQPFLAMLLRLTLDDFDNTEYDIRTPQQWIEMGHQVL